MTARSDLATAIGDYLTDRSALTWRVIDRARDIDRVEAGTTVLMVYQDTVTPGTARSLNRTMQLWIVTGKADPGDADDVLDEGLDDVIAALDAIHPVLFQSAERGALQEEAFAGYRVEVQYITQKE